MRRDNLFWGGILILFGVLFFLQASGVIQVANLWGMFWPLFLMLLGVWILAGVFFPPKGNFIPGNAEQAIAIDLGGALRVNYDLSHGAGTVEVTGGAPAGIALSGVKAAGMSVKSNLDDGELEIDLNAGPTFIPWLGPSAGVWQFYLTNEVPVSLDVDAGAATMTFDLTDVKLSTFEMNTGASTVKLLLPRTAGNSIVEFECGAATLDLRVPEGVAARIQLEGGMSTVQVDQARFPKVSHDLYQSADFATAQNKVDIRIEGGANTIDVH